MSNKYQTGDYLTLFFDVYGTQQDSVASCNFLEADANGRKGIKTPPYASYVVVRVMTNSLDRANPWSCSQEIPEFTKQETLQ